MKHAKKIMALVIAMVMVVAMAVPAMATTAGGGDTPAATEYDHPLKVTGLEKDDVAHFYKIVEWVGEADGNVSGWKAIAPFDQVLTKDVLTAVLVGRKEATQADVDLGFADKVGDKFNAGGITSILAGKIAKKVAANTEKTDVTVTSDTAELNNPAAGLWMAIITPKNQDVVYNPVFVGADYDKDKSGDVAVEENAASYSDEAAAKRSKVELKKTASTTEDEWDAKEGGKAQWTTTAIGDTVSYTVETTIPGFGEVYTNPVFILRDKLTDLALKTDTVTVVTPEDAVKDTDYTVDATAAGYTITFKADYLKKLATPTAVKVTYDAIVTTTAPVHVNTEKNEVSTEFSHNPSDESDHGFKKDTTQHYTFTIDANGLGSDSSKSGKRTSELIKVGVDAKGDPITETRTSSQITEEKFVKGPLDGAEFKLYTDSAATSEYIPKKADGTQGTALVIKSGTDGRMTIPGLDAGTYYLQESKAPTGYVKDTRIIPIVITATTRDVDVTEYTTDGVTWITQGEYDKLSADAKKAYKSYKFSTPILDTYTITIDGKNTSTYHFTNIGTSADIKWTETPPVEVPTSIVNVKGTELPSTGGIGTTLFYIVGAILVLGAGVVLVTRRRMGAN